MKPLTRQELEVSPDHVYGAIGTSQTRCPTQIVLNHNDLPGVKFIVGIPVGRDGNVPPRTLWIRDNWGLIVSHTIP